MQIHVINLIVPTVSWIVYDAVDMLHGSIVSRIVVDFSHFHIPIYFPGSIFREVIHSDVPALQRFSETCFFFVCRGFMFTR